MKWNPYINAVAATAYISLIGLIFRHISLLHKNTPDTLIDPIAALSVLVFSVAVMGFLFFYRPVMLLIENKKAEAVHFFFKTLGTFGVITLAVVITLL
jgi:hypothetical protein